jgi:hypothetical protein
VRREDGRIMTECGRRCRYGEAAPGVHCRTEHHPGHRPSGVGGRVLVAGAPQVTEPLLGVDAAEFLEPARYRQFS